MPGKTSQTLGKRQRNDQPILWRAAPQLALLLVVFVLAGSAASAAHPGQRQQVQRVAVRPTSTATLPTVPTATSTAQPPTATPTPAAPGWDPQQLSMLADLGNPAKAILVSLTNQVMYVYQDGALVNWTYVTTGRPELQSPKGIWHVFERLHPTTFYSPFPPGSPYWYPPTFINYALEYHDGGFFLHDATWRHYYGPGTNTWHENPDQTWETGTHGCVNMPLDFMQWLYDWTPLGTPVVLY